MKSKKIIYVGTCVLALVLAGLFVQARHVKLSQTQTSSAPVSKERAPQKEALSAPVPAPQPETTATPATPASSPPVDLAESPAVVENVSATAPAAPASQEAPPAQPARDYDAEIQKLTQSLLAKTLEIDNLRNDLAAKERELVSARSWTNSQNEVVAKLRAEINELTKRTHVDSENLVRKQEIMQGVKERTFIINP